MLALKVLAQVKKLNINKTVEVLKKNLFLVTFLVVPKIMAQILNLLLKTLTPTI